MTENYHSKKNSEPVDVTVLTDEPNSVFVSGFGNTLKRMNGKTKIDNGFDWYFKGGGATLLFDEAEIVFPKYGLWPGVEAELVAIHGIDENKNPVYLGYTLGIDYTKTGIRRIHKNMANLSHLASTLVSSEIIHKDYPKSMIIHTRVMRNDVALVENYDDAGMDNMFESFDSIFESLFNNKELLIPGMIFYTLTGATFSSDKIGVRLQRGDDVIVNAGGLSLSIRFKNLGE